MMPFFIRAMVEPSTETNLPVGGMPKKTSVFVPLKVELLEGFCNKGSGAGIPGAVKGGIVGVGGKVDDGDVFLLEARGGFDVGE